MRGKLAEFLNKEVEFIGTYVKEINFHPYHDHSNIPVLHFNDLIIAETGEKVARHFYLNKSMTTTKANLSRGDVIRFKAKVFYYRSGSQYNRLTITRTPTHDYRLLYPKDIEIIRNIEVPHRKVLDLKTLDIYDDYLSYSNTIRSREDIEMLKIHILDNDYLCNLFNSKGNIVNKSYPPICIYLDRFKALNEAQQNILLNARSYKLDKLQELFAILKNI